MTRSLLFLAVAIVVVNASCRQTPNDVHTQAAVGDSSAEVGNDGFVTGTVVDRNGVGINMVSVSLTPLTSLEPDSTIYGAMTFTDGTFLVNGLQPGRYVLDARAPGIVGRDTVQVSAGDTTHTTVETNV